MSFVDKVFNLLKWDVSKFIIVPLLVLVLFIILLNEIIMPIYTRHGQAVRVPQVVDMTYESARTLLERSDLVIVEQAKKFDSHFRAGVIMAQNPNVDSNVKKGRRVYVLVSKGEPLVDVPRLIGLSERNAVFEISKVGLELRSINYQHSDQIHNGVVMEQSMSENLEVKAGQKIDIVISLGRFPNRFIVPDIIGRSLKDAKRVIKQYGLAVGYISFQKEPELLPETVIEQSLVANSEVSKGSAIDLIVSKME